MNGRVQQPSPFFQGRTEGNIKPGSVTYGFSEAAHFPPLNEQVQGNWVDSLNIAEAVARNAIGQTANAMLNNFIVNPIQAAGKSALDSFIATPGGQLVANMVDQASTQYKVVTADGTPIGNTLAFVDKNFVRNEALWTAVGTAGDVGLNLVKVGLGGTVATLVAASQNGTLEIGQFNTGDPLTPEQSEMQRAINIPKGMDVIYWRTEGSIDVSVNGVVRTLPTRTFIAFAAGQNTVLLPATGLGKPGAQPWIGYDTNSNKVTVASSSVGAAGWGIMGFSNGTTNFNTSGRVDIQAMRALWNAVAITSGANVPGGETTNAVKSILIADPLSTFVTGTINVGPAAFVVERFRNPQSERVTFPGGVNITTEPHPSRVVPAVPLTGSATFDPKAKDWKLMGDILGVQK